MKKKNERKITQFLQRKKGESESKRKTQREKKTRNYIERVKKNHMSEREGRLMRKMNKNIQLEFGFQ